MIFKKILICAFLAEVCEALNCYTCSYQFDNNGNQIGTGDETCYTGQFGLNREVDKITRFSFLFEFLKKSN